MGDLNRTTYFYRLKFKSKEKRHNKPMRLPAYFGPMLEGKKHMKVRIAEVGAGPINTIGNWWPDLEVEILASDVMQPEYQKFWEYHKKTPIVPVTYEDFENLSYDDESFDVVHCVNAIDHTENADKALAEVERVCKRGGWVYLRHSPDQMTEYGGMHRWNVHVRNGVCEFEGKTRTFALPDVYKTTVDIEDGLITSLWHKI